jgi:hypothetical protein
MRLNIPLRVNAHDVYLFLFLGGVFIFSIPGFYFSACLEQVFCFFTLVG